MNGINAVLANTRPWHVETADVLAGLRTLSDGCVQCVVDSPPYWGLRDYGVDGQIGLEETPEAYIARMVEVYREVRRVLRDDGTLWLNIGDSYATGGGAVGRCPGGGAQGERFLRQGHINTQPNRMKIPGYKPKDLVGIPWLLAFALRADGWYLRSEIIWHKKAPMPESVRDRPTKAHEQVFLLTKSARYYYDHVASGEAMAPESAARYAYGFGGAKSEALVEANKDGIGQRTRPVGERQAADVRNMRSVWDQQGVSLAEVVQWLDGRVPSEVMAELAAEFFPDVWTLGPESFKGAHFATMPTELARRCLLAGTSEKGCCSACGAPWRRVVEKERRATRPGTNSKVNRAAKSETSPYHEHTGAIVGNRDPQRHTTITRTAGWEPGCKCEAPTVPCLVLDPFNGAGTTGVVARRLGLRYIGFELNPEYAAMSRERISEDMPLLNRVS